MDEPAHAVSSRWLEELARQLRRGKHVVLHGNVRDRAIYKGTFCTFSDALERLLKALGYRLRCRYNVADGLTFARPEMHTRFRELERDPTLDRPPPGVEAQRPPDPSRPPSPAARGPAAHAAPAPPSPYLLPPDLAFAAIRRVFSAPDEPLKVAVLDFSDKLFMGGQGQSAAERGLMVTLNLASSEARRETEGRFSGMRNVILLVAPTLGQVPSWLYRDNPYFHVITVDRPPEDERRRFIQREYGNFYGVAGGVPSAAVEEEFVALTDGMTYWDLEALRLTSLHERLSVDKASPLVDFFRHGVAKDPWEHLNKVNLQEAAKALTARVIGQDQSVINTVVNTLICARGGVQIEGAGRRSSRPKGVLFFVGPTGVGKTEMSKAITELIFHDDAAFARFDMSEYAQEHAAERLTGAPPSYVGYEAGGQLTNRLKTHPFSVILFDEIEKAHPRVMDKFLQVLDDGRLTDGLGETVFFSQALIIFTSNIGSTREAAGPDGVRHITSALAPDQPYDVLANHFRKEVRDHFVRIGRPELLGRIGEENVVVFDMLRPEHIPAILQKFLNGIGASVKERYRVRLSFDPSITRLATEYCARPEVVLLGGRGIRNFVQSRVLVAVNRAVLNLGPLDEGKQFVAIARAAEVFVEPASP